MQEFFTIHKSISVTQHNYKLKNKSHMIISIDAAKAFDKIQHPFMINTLQKVEREETHLSIIRVIYDKSIANIFLRGEKQNIFPKNIFLTGQGCSILTTFIQHTVRYHMPVTVAIIKKFTNSRCWRGCGEKETLL